LSVTENLLFSVNIIVLCYMLLEFTWEWMLHHKWKELSPTIDQICAECCAYWTVWKRNENRRKGMKMKEIRNWKCVLLSSSVVYIQNINFFFVVLIINMWIQGTCNVK
jgi:hypothetical protein